VNELGDGHGGKQNYGVNQISEGEKPSAFPSVFRQQSTEAFQLFDPEPSTSMHNANPDNSATTPHMNKARYLVVAGWVLFMISLFLPLQNTDLGYAALIYSFVFLMSIFDRLEPQLIWMGSYALVNAGMIVSLFIAWKGPLISHPRCSLFFTLAAVDTLFAPLFAKEFTQYPAFWCWAASVILVASGMNLARLQQNDLASLKARH
jgi:hypothetical protein